MLALYKRLTPTQSLTTSESKRDVWMNLIQPTATQLHEICDSLYLPYENMQHLLDKNEKAQIEVGDGYLLIVFQIPHGPKVSPFSLIITRSAIITIALENYDFLQNIITKTPANFFTNKRIRATLIFYRLALRAFMDGLDQIEKSMEQLEQKIERQRRPETALHQILKLQKQLIYYNTAVVANEAILEKMLQDSNIPKYQSDQEEINDLLLENNQAKAMVKIYTEILATIADTYSAMLSSNVNHTMKLLTSFTIIMTIPTIVSSFYGMNIGLPLQGSPAAFIVVMLLTLFLVLLTSIIFRLMRWF